MTTSWWRNSTLRVLNAAADLKIFILAVQQSAQHATMAARVAAEMGVAELANSRSHRRNVQPIQDALKRRVAIHVA